MAASATAAAWLLLLLLQVTVPAIAAGDDDEAAALLAFKRASVSHDPRGALAGWSRAAANSTAPWCSWVGVSCSNGRVAALNLSGMSLAGELHLDALLSLPSLQLLHLRGNAFHGNLSLSSSSYATPPCALVDVDLSSNALNGTLPPAFLPPCAALRSLNLSRNSLAGGGFPFPPSLRVLDLSRNAIADAALLNYSFTTCHGLVHLNLSANNLAGRLPPLLLSSCGGELAVLDVSWNHMSGGLPAGLVSAAPASLAHLSIAGNNFTGDVSAFDFGGCANLTVLDWSYNGLSGSLPPGLAGCRRLETLDVSGNKALAGPIPAFLTGFSSLRRLALAGNEFSGTIPGELS
ncbi:unnamed protein product [Urochloa humidicola]